MGSTCVVAPLLVSAELLAIALGEGGMDLSDPKLARRRNPLGRGMGRETSEVHCLVVCALSRSGKERELHRGNPFTVGSVSKHDRLMQSLPYHG